MGTMRRLRFALFTLLAACSLAISVTAVAGWFLRTSGTDHWIWMRSTPPSAADPFFRWDQWQLTFAGGAIVLDRYKVAREDSDIQDRAQTPVNTFKHEVDLPQHTPLVTLPTWRNIQWISKTYFLYGQFGAGASWYDGPGYGSRRYWAIRGPLWFVMIAGAIPALAWEIRYRKWVRRQWRIWRGLCATCGYDLRATSDRCPECGQRPPKKTRWKWWLFGRAPTLQIPNGDAPTPK